MGGWDFRVGNFAMGSDPITKSRPDPITKPESVVVGRISE